MKGAIANGRMHQSHDIALLGDEIANPAMQAEDAERRGGERARGRGGEGLAEGRGGYWILGIGIGAWALSRSANIQYRIPNTRFH